MCLCGGTPVHPFCMRTLLLVLPGLAGSSSCLDFFPGAVLGVFLHGFFVLIVFHWVGGEGRRLNM